MMRDEIMRTIRCTLKEFVPEVRHIDLWNHNVEFLDEETAWERPAVFVEFGPISWKPFQGIGLRGQGVVRVHTVTDWDDGGQEAAWRLCRKICDSLGKIVLGGDYFGGLTLVETVTNHNHEEILESIDSFAVRYVLMPFDVATEGSKDE